MLPRLTHDQIETAIRLQSEFWIHERIAEHLGVSRVTVSRHLSKYNRKAMVRLEKQAAAVKSRQVAQLEWVASQSVEAWHRSKEDAETVKTTDGLDDKGRPVNKTETMLKGQSGNPALLTVALNALADVRKILALEPKTAPQRGNDDPGDIETLLSECDDTGGEAAGDRPPPGA